MILWIVAPTAKGILKECFLHDRGFQVAIIIVLAAFGGLTYFGYNYVKADQPTEENKPAIAMVVTAQSRSKPASPLLPAAVKSHADLPLGIECHPVETGSEQYCHVLLLHRDGGYEDMMLLCGRGLETDHGKPIQGCTIVGP